ncbi:MAG: FHA domain-containing protein [Anaerolineae bacterium]
MCERCGKVFSDEATLATRKMRRVYDLTDPFEFDPTSTTQISPGNVTFQLLESADSIMIELSSRIVIGRESNRSVQKPDVDLTPFDGFSKGVSGRHAAIYRMEDGLKISDLGSVNGTYLNREGLVPNAAYDLHDGDILELGQLALCVRF